MFGRAILRRGLLLADAFMPGCSEISQFCCLAPLLSALGIRIVQRVIASKIGFLKTTVGSAPAGKGRYRIHRCCQTSSTDYETASVHAQACRLRATRKPSWSCSGERWMNDPRHGARLAPGSSDGDPRIIPDRAHRTYD